MTRSFGIVEEKVQESEFFLLKMIDKNCPFFAYRFYGSAFTSACRSITFAMQSSIKGADDFEKWYESKQKILRNDHICRYFNEFRTISQHIGENPIRGGSSGPNRPTLYHFLSVPDLVKAPELDVTACSEYYFKYILEIVYDSFLVFGPLIDGRQRYTKENFSKLRKTIEDAEEELGFPRGWTKVSGFSDEARWKIIRKNVDGCNIEQQFIDWLDKDLTSVLPKDVFDRNY
jgi:hypothetical protein